MRLLARRPRLLPLRLGILEVAGEGRDLFVPLGERRLQLVDFFGQLGGPVDLCRLLRLG